jgi:hypothetical protein
MGSRDHSGLSKTYTDYFQFVESGVKHHNPNPFLLFFLNSYTPVILTRLVQGLGVLGKQNNLTFIF